LTPIVAAIMGASLKVKIIWRVR